MIFFEDIIDAYYSARKNKRRSPDQVEFELHWQMNCWKIYNDIINRCFQPKAYTFIVDHPKPREVFASDMSTRVLHHYLDIRIRGILESHMSEHTFNNRKGMGQNACQNAVITDIYDVSKGFTQDAYIIKIDLKGCFPNINQDIAYKQLESLIINDYIGDDKDELLYILSICIYSYPTQHCYRKDSLSSWNKIPVEKSLFSKPPGIGAAIGHLIWQNAVNYYFHEVLDEYFINLGIRYERYVDDIYIITNSKTVLLIIPQIRKLLDKYNAKLNENKFYCQYYDKGCECLGTHIKKDRIYINNRIIRFGRNHIYRLNHNISVRKINTLLSSINSYLGMCKNVNGYNRAKYLLSIIDKKWFKYIKFNRSRVCIEALTSFKERNILIFKYIIKAKELY